MPSTIRINDHLGEKIGALAADVGFSLDAFVERILETLTEPGFVFRDGIPVFRMPGDASSLTSAEVDRLLHGDT